MASSSRSRAARRAFWGSPVLWRTGQILDALRPLAARLTVFLLAATFVLLGSVTDVHPTACPTEDSTFCYWNARTHGNGSGHSFIALWDGFTIPVP